jgi:hypothetical protein
MARKENLEVTIESNRAPISASLALPWLDELAVALVIGHGYGRQCRFQAACRRLDHLLGHSVLLTLVGYRVGS